MYCMYVSEPQSGTWGVGSGEIRLEPHFLLYFFSFSLPPPAPRSAWQALDKEKEKKKKRTKKTQLRNYQYPFSPFLFVCLFVSFPPLNSFFPLSLS